MEYVEDMSETLMESVMYQQTDMMHFLNDTVQHLSCNMTCLNNCWNTSITMTSQVTCMDFCQCYAFPEFGPAPVALVQE